MDLKKFMNKIKLPSIKYSNKGITFFFGLIFLCLLILIYTKKIPHDFIVWVLFLPIKLLELLGSQVIHLAIDQNILFSLFLGVPLTAFYWILFLGLAKK